MFSAHQKKKELQHFQQIFYKSSKVEISAQRLHIFSTSEREHIFIGLAAFLQKIYMQFIC